MKLKYPSHLVADLVHDGRADILSETEFTAVQMKLVGPYAKDAQAALAIMDRFQLIPVTAEKRMTLSVALRTHLDAIDSQCVRLVVMDGRLSLWSERVWRQNRSSRMEVTAQLLGR